MKPTVVALLLLACNLVADAGSRQSNQSQITASTAEAELLEGGAVLFMEAEAVYRKWAEQMTAMKEFVPMRRLPPGLSPDARFGINLVIAGQNLSWAIDGNPEKGYTLYADLNANGDLGDDRPLRFENKGGKHELLLETMARETVKGRQESYPVKMKFVVSEARLSGANQATKMVIHNSGTLRRGIIRVGGRDVAFGLWGSSGLYNDKYNRVIFDLNGDGNLDMDPGKSIEPHRVSEKYVNIGDASYEFTVDRYGRSLALKLLAEKLPARAILLPGHPAPDFTFTDINGNPHKLSDYRGKVVLLDFWGTWCPSCAADAPKVAEIYRRFHNKGFEIIGVAAEDTAEAVRKYTSQKNMPWAQALEAEDGPIYKLFRVDRWPTYYLIGKDGGILWNGKIDWSAFPAELENHLGLR